VAALPALPMARQITLGGKPWLTLSRVRQAGQHIVMGELREILQQFGFSHAAGETAEDIAHGEPGAANARLAEAHRRIDRDPLKESHRSTLGRQRHDLPGNSPLATPAVFSFTGFPGAAWRLAAAQRQASDASLSCRPGVGFRAPAAGCPVAGRCRWPPSSSAFCPVISFDPQPATPAPADLLAHLLQECSAWGR
jgi:hypothetical protein